MFHNDLILMKSQNKNASSYWPFSLANIIHFQVKDSMIFDLVVVWTTGSLFLIWIAPLTLAINRP